MKMKQFLKVTVILSMTALASQVFAGSATPSSILVVPARARMVQLAFHVASVKDVGLVCYDNNAVSKDLLIHVWNGQEWIRITSDEYTSGAFMSGTAQDVFVLGPATTVPAVMSIDPAWGKTTHRITELDSAIVLNELGKVMNFSSRQWKWLAEKNGMLLTDKNAERRRYGRWGKSGIDASALPPRTATPAPVPTPAANDVITMPPSAASPDPAPIAPPIAPAVTAPEAPAIAAPAATPSPTIK
jgi:hypothetical protein